MSKFTVTTKIEKVDPEQRLVFGWMYMSQTADGTQVLDHSDQYILPDDLETAAYDYVLNARRASLMHEEFTDANGDPLAGLCEAVVTTREKQKAWGLPDGALPVGLWVGFKIFDDGLWQMIKSGELQMFSIGGEGTLEPDATAQA